MTTSNTFGREPLNNGHVVLVPVEDRHPIGQLLSREIDVQCLFLLIGLLLLTAETR